MGVSPCTLALKRTVSPSSTGFGLALIDVIEAGWGGGTTVTEMVSASEPPSLLARKRMEYRPVEP